MVLVMTFIPNKDLRFTFTSKSYAIPRPGDYVHLRSEIVYLVK